MGTQRSGPVKLRTVSLEFLPCPATESDGGSRSKKDIEAEVSSLVRPSADQYNASFHSMLDKHMHVPVAKGAVTKTASSSWFSLVSEEFFGAKRKS